MKEILVIPDIHGRNFWKEAVEKYPEADTIFLGDYLDPYPHEGISHREARENFKEILEYAKSHDNVTLLFGNHDLVYWFPYNWGRKDISWEEELRKIFRTNLNIFQMFAVREVNGKKWLFSHAPLFEEWIEYTNMPHDLDAIKEDLWKRLDAYDEDDDENWKERNAARESVWKSLGRASKLRGGIDKCGSPVWADVKEITEECNLYKYADYYVFGHTQTDEPIITDTYACLDTHQAYIVTPEGKIKAVTEKHTPKLPEDKGFSLF